MDIVQRELAFLIARYITLYIESSSGKLDLFLVTFRKEKFRDSIALVVYIDLRISFGSLLSKINQVLFKVCNS